MWNEIIIQCSTEVETFRMRTLCSLRCPWDSHGRQILFMGFLLYFVVAEGTLLKRIPMKTQNFPLNPCQKCIRLSFAGIEVPLKYLKMLFSQRKKNKQPAQFPKLNSVFVINSQNPEDPPLKWHISRPFLPGELKEWLPGNPAGIFQPWTIIIRALPSLGISLMLS